VCNDPAVIIAMATNSACLLGCRVMLYWLGIKSLILLLIGMAGSVLHTAECGWALTGPRAELQTRQKEERHLY